MVSRILKTKRITMRQNIVEILKELANGNRPFYGQDSLPKASQELCRLKLMETTDIVLLNKFFDEKIADIIFHSHYTYLAYR